MDSMDIFLTTWDKYQSLQDFKKCNAEGVEVQGNKVCEGSNKLPVERYDLSYFLQVETSR